MKTVIGVTIEDREDGGIRVYSDDLPGLLLSGKNRVSVLADIEPAARAILEYSGKNPGEIQINATFVTPAR